MLDDQADRSHVFRGTMLLPGGSVDCAQAILQVRIAGRGLSYRIGGHCRCPVHIVPVSVRLLQASVSSDGMGHAVDRSRGSDVMAIDYLLLC